MPDERVLERWFERGIEAIDALTKTVARAAFALELVAAADRDEDDLEAAPCRACGSQLVPKSADACMACGTEKEKTDG